MRVWRLLGGFDAETKTYSAFAIAGLASPYNPDFNGTLVGLRAIGSHAAVTTLQEHVQIRLTSVAFTPNTIEVGCQGNGLATAPAFPAPIIEWPVSQPVKSSVAIHLEGRNLTADTPVGVEVYLYGLFEVNPRG